MSRAGAGIGGPQCHLVRTMLSCRRVAHTRFAVINEPTHKLTIVTDFSCANKAQDTHRHWFATFIIRNGMETPWMLGARISSRS